MVPELRIGLLSVIATVAAPAAVVGGVVDVVVTIVGGGAGIFCPGGYCMK